MSSSNFEQLRVLEQAVRRHPGGVTARQIAETLGPGIAHRTLQLRLKRLVDEGRLVQKGTRRWAIYHLPDATVEAIAAKTEAAITLSKKAAEIRTYLRQPMAARKPVGYNREFLDSYRPNETFYLSQEDRARLAAVGKPNYKSEPAAGTYAKQLLSRLLIDLSWNSSRLEGNTYSLLDTRRLIEFGQEVAGRDRRDAQMILNHKDAIEFLVSSVREIGFKRIAVLNLHAILANNLLADETAAGRLRHMGVGIEKSTFHPLEMPQLIEECFNQILATAAAMSDPFEQAFFVMVHLPYLQPFDDVNKRVSRLAANIPFIENNLCPLSFTDVPRDIYTDAVLGVYELNRIELLRDVFVWAYERSAARYAAVRQSLGEPDPFRLKYRDALRDVVGTVVRARMGRKSAFDEIQAFSKQKVDTNDQAQFREMVETELLGLHEGNFARYRITPREFTAWYQGWAPKDATQ